MKSKVFLGKTAHFMEATLTSMLKTWTGTLRSGGDPREYKVKVEEPQFPLDRGYFGLHLVLEHHVLRRMDDGGRCVMSRMEPARDESRE